MHNLLVNKKLLVTKGIATSSKKLLVAPRITTSNKKLLVRYLIIGDLPDKLVSCVHVTYRPTSGAYRAWQGNNEELSGPCP